MPTRLVISGRPVWTSRDWPFPRGTLAPVPRSVPTGTVGPSGVDRFDESGVRLVPPVEVPKRRPGIPTFDPVDRVTYRVVGRLDPREGWVPVNVVMAWYGVAHAAVMDWVRRGVVDGAYEAGSPTKRFRVVDATRCRAESARALTAPAPKPKRGRRARNGGVNG